jgi:aminoglycoside phosphotransferase (APT) family kinase protein
MRDAPTRCAIEALRGMVDTDAVTAAWNAALQIPEWPARLNGRLSAVIDFAAVGVGDPACDLPVAWNLLPAGVRNIFRAALQVDDATWARGRGWALAMALVQLPYYRNTNPVLAANARHVIHEVLADQPGEPLRRLAVRPDPP